jgi:hypothetical protein
VRGYYSDLEVGVLNPKPVDGRVWDALAHILDANVRVLAGLRPPPPASVVAYRRSASGMELYERISTGPPGVLASMYAARAPEDDRDEVDRLFTGTA